MTQATKTGGIVGSAFEVDGGSRTEEVSSPAT